MSKLKLNIGNSIIIIPDADLSYGIGKTGATVVRYTDVKKRRLLGLEEYDLTETVIDDIAKCEDIKSKNIIIITTCSTEALCGRSTRECIIKAIKKKPFIIKNIVSGRDYNIQNIIAEVNEGIGVQDILITYIYKGLYNISGIGNTLRNSVEIYGRGQYIGVEIQMYKGDIISLNHRSEDLRNKGIPYVVSEVYKKEGDKEFLPDEETVLRLCDKLYRICGGAFISEVKANMFSIVHHENKIESVNNVLKSMGMDRCW